MSQVVRGSDGKLYQVIGEVKQKKRQRDNNQNKEANRKRKTVHKNNNNNNRNGKKGSSSSRRKKVEAMEGSSSSSSEDEGEEEIMLDDQEMLENIEELIELDSDEEEETREFIAETVAKINKKRGKQEEDEKGNEEEESEEGEIEDDETLKEESKKPTFDAEDIPTIEEMQRLCEIELEKKYNYCVAFVTKYKKIKNEKSEMPAWKKANVMLTNSAAILARLKALEGSQLQANVPLSQAVPKLREKGEKMFKEALEIVEKLSLEDQDKFWSLQIRNKGVTKFDDLKTIKTHQEEKIQSMISESVNQSVRNILQAKGVEVEEQMIVASLPPSIVSKQNPPTQPTPVPAVPILSPVTSNNNNNTTTTITMMSTQESIPSLIN